MTAPHLALSALRTADEASPLYPSAGSSLAYGARLLLLPVLSRRNQGGPRRTGAPPVSLRAGSVAEWFILLDLAGDERIQRRDG